MIFGADAVYIGGEVFRTPGEGEELSMEDMKEGVEFAHAHGVKVYVTANILAHNQDLEGVRAYFAELKRLDRMHSLFPDQECIASPWNYCPEIERHINSQANNTNYGTYQFWYERGQARRDSAGAVASGDQRDSGGYIPEEMESGRCLFMGDVYFVLSGKMSAVNYFTGRDANQNCTHPMPVEVYGRGRVQTGGICRCMRMRRGTYIFNSKDLCMS